MSDGGRGVLSEKNLIGGLRGLIVEPLAFLFTVLGIAKKNTNYHIYTITVSLESLSTIMIHIPSSSSMSLTK